MDALWWVLLALFLGLLAGLGFGLRPFLATWRETQFAKARRGFHWERERLEAKFLQLGLAGDKPDGPRWTDCDFDDDVAYARSRSSGELSAFVAVTIEVRNDRLSDTGGAGGTLRDATAVFRFDRGHWKTDGRAIFNLSPTEAIHFYQRDLEMVAQELASRP
jgi:hypothetical protein